MAPESFAHPFAHVADLPCLGFGASPLRFAEAKARHSRPPPAAAVPATPARMACCVSTPQAINR